LLIGLYEYWLFGLLDEEVGERDRRSYEYKSSKELADAHGAAEYHKAIGAEPLDPKSSKAVPTEYHYKHLTVILAVLIEKIYKYKANEIPKRLIEKCRVDEYRLCG
jgi:hypothetical protein